MKDKVIPTIVLTLICVISAVLLVFSHELTKDRIADQKEQKFNKSVEALFGECDSTLIDDNFGHDEVEAIAVTSDGKTAIQVVADGYSKDGINILVGIDEKGALSGIDFVSLGETPGLGSKVRDIESFRDQFIGITEAPEEVDAISGATITTTAVTEAVNEAISLYNNVLKGE